MASMILPKQRDPRLITVRRGGTLTDEHHRLLAAWAVACAEHVLPLFLRERPDDDRPALALAIARRWIAGDARMTEAHDAAFPANAAGRGLPDAARFAALSAGQAVAVAHVAAHDLGAAAYAIRARTAADSVEDGHEERDWQREHLPPEVRALVLDDQRRRNDLCWGVFED